MLLLLLLQWSLICYSNTAKKEPNKVEHPAAARLWIATNVQRQFGPETYTIDNMFTGITCNIVSVAVT